MTVRKLNLEDFKENQLSRQQTAYIIGCAPPLPPPIEIDEDGNPVGGNNGGDSGDDGIGGPFADPTKTT